MAELLPKSAEVSAKYKDGWTPLHEAARKGFMDVAELLIAKGADVNAKRQKWRDAAAPCRLL